MARTPFAAGRRRGPQNRQDAIRWRCARPMKKTTHSPTSRSGIQEGTSGIGSSGRKSSWEMPAKERTTMKNKVQAFFLVMGGLVIAAGVVYGDLKKGYYSPAELGSVRQAAPVELLPDSRHRPPGYTPPGAYP